MLNNGNIIVGKTKAMDKGVVVIETDYSEDDFRIEWEGIKELYISTRYSVSLSNGGCYIGSIRSTNEETAVIITEEGEKVVFIKDIVYMREVEESIPGNVTAYIDLGLSL